MEQARREVATWRIVLAFFLDLVTAFLVFGYLVALVTGNATQSGFALNGWPVLILLALSIACFWLAKRFGGRFWERMLGAVRN